MLLNQNICSFLSNSILLHFQLDFPTVSTNWYIQTKHLPPWTCFSFSNSYLYISCPPIFSFQLCKYPCCLPKGHFPYLSYKQKNLVWALMCSAKKKHLLDSFVARSGHLTQPGQRDVSRIAGWDVSKSSFKRDQLSWHMFCLLPFLFFLPEKGNMWIGGSKPTIVLTQMVSRTRVTWRVSEQKQRIRVPDGILKPPY